MKRPIEATAEAVLTPDLHPIRASSLLTVRLVFFNVTDEIIAIHPLKPLGKEQFKKSEKALNLLKNNQIFSAYLDQIKVTYKDETGQATFQCCIPFPIGSIITPKKYVEVILQIPTPTKPGRYNLDFQAIPSTSDPNYNTIPIKDNNRVVSVGQIPNFGINNIEVVANETSSGDPIQN